MSGSPRRVFLKRGLLGGALLTVGGASLALFPSAERATPTGPLLALTPGAFGVLVHVAARMVAAPGADAEAIARGVDATLAHAPPEVRDDLQKLLLLMENGLAGLLLDGQPLPFSRRSAAAQEATLDGWANSRLTLRRAGYQALRKLCHAAHYGDPRAWPAISYSVLDGIHALAIDDPKAGTAAWRAAAAARGAEAPGAEAAPPVGAVGTTTTATRAAEVTR